MKCMTFDDLSTLQPLANAVRVLAMDAIERSRSGHPGMPMGMADVATVLFGRHLKFDPQRPLWPDRDRFVLSAGHGSMLLYALAYLTGYPAMTRDQLESFRQLHSLAAGHPEYHPAIGVETTTGPLGQGLANAVGMALAERMLAGRFGADLVDHRTWVIAGDGCLMEGITHEAASLAGHLRLSHLTVLFDDNHISIDGPTSLAVSDDHLKRFESYGWFVQSIDGHNFNEIDHALARVRESDRPSLIACRTIIGKGASPTHAGTAAVHGSPLGTEETERVRKNLNWQWPPFEIPPIILDPWRHIGLKGAHHSTAWNQRLSAASPEAIDLFRDLEEGKKVMPENLDSIVTGFINEARSNPASRATRQTSGDFLDAVVPNQPTLAGGSADLTGSNNTRAKATIHVAPENDYHGQYIHYGVREHAMAAAMNGIALHGGFIPFGGTFLVFSDYCRPAIRLSALMKQRVIYVMTHDSIGLGEDGPTHQPVEHLASLRAMPNLLVFRPADAVEVAECWALALKTEDAPSILALSRQAVPLLRIEKEEENLSARGAYILRKSTHIPERVRIFATGTETSLAVSVHTALLEKGVGSSVVSMPCHELFNKQSASYRDKILGSSDLLRVGIEAATSFGWDKYLRDKGLFFGLDSFGASAPARDLYEYYGLTTDRIMGTILATL